MLLRPQATRPNVMHFKSSFAFEAMIQSWSHLAFWKHSIASGSPAWRKSSTLLQDAELRSVVMELMTDLRNLIWSIVRVFARSIPIMMNIFVLTRASSGPGNARVVGG